jgi:hypothetical protein
LTRTATCFITYIGREVIMGYSRKHVCVSVVGSFLVLGLFCSFALAQQAVPVMTLADGTKVAMTQAQFDSLVTQPGITYYGPIGGLPKVPATQMAVPVPSSLGGNLGGGFIVGEPAAIAAGMNAVGITSAATRAGLVGGTAAAGSISAGAAAAGSGGAGTIAVGAGILAIGAPAAGGGESGATTGQH